MIKNKKKINKIKISFKILIYYKKIIQIISPKIPFNPKIRISIINNKIINQN